MAVGKSTSTTGHRAGRREREMGLAVVSQFYQFYLRIARLRARARLVVMQYSLLKREGAARTQRSEAAHGGLLSARMEWDGLQVTLR